MQMKNPIIFLNTPPSESIPYLKFQLLSVFFGGYLKKRYLLKKESKLSDSMKICDLATQFLCSVMNTSWATIKMFDNWALLKQN